MRMNALIPLMVQGPDIAGAMARGERLGREAGMNKLFQDHGAGIASGDPNALNKLAQFDPQMAMQMQNQHTRAGYTANAEARAAASENRAQGRYNADMAQAERKAQTLRALDASLDIMASSNTPSDFHKGMMAAGLPVDDLSTVEQQWENRFQYLQLRTLPVEKKLEALVALEQGEDPSAAEQKISRIMDAYGVDRRMAVGIVDGVLNVSRHPMDGSIVITDLSNNQVTTPVQAEPQQPSDMPERGNSFAGTNPRGGVGAGGAIASLANTILDSIGLGQIAPDIDRAQTAMDSLATRTVQGLSAQWPGRPSNLTREMIDAMTVRPGDFTTGPGRAANKVADMKREMERAIASAHRVSTSQGQYSKAQIAEAQAALNDLLPLYQDYIDLEEGLAGHSETQGQTKSGIQWSVEP
ncbi:MAG: hypothetical protein AAGA74_20465 [Pseudomonadota bacterium]